MGLNDSFGLAAALQATLDRPFGGRGGGVVRNLYGELFGFRREVDEMFNRILTGRPVTEWPELPVFQKEFGFTPAVETYVDKQEYANGVLEIMAPLIAAALPRKVEIKALPSVKQVTA
jgi:hypothetical protein